VCPPQRRFGRFTLSKGVQIFDATSFATADASSSFRLDVEAIDDIGNLPAARIVLYGTRTDLSEWQINAVIDGGSVSGTQSALVPIEAWTLTFAPDGSLAGVSEAIPSMTVSNLSTGASNLNVALDYGTIGAADGLSTGVAITGVTETHNGAPRCNAADCPANWTRHTLATKCMYRSASWRKPRRRNA
jgi:hypothetical protein